MNSVVAFNMGRPITFVVKFMSPFFLLYVKCPNQRHWQLVRAQTKPTTVVDGSISVMRYPVLLFVSAKEASVYATDELGVAPFKATWLARNITWLAPLAEFEPFELSGETVFVEKEVLIEPIIFTPERNSNGNESEA